MMSLAVQILIFPAAIVGAVVVPIEGEVIRRFDPALCAYCPGHRGVTVDSTQGDEIVAVARGEITFAGQVGGRMYVVHNIAPQVRVTYGAVAAIADAIVQGSWVEAGQVLAIAQETTYLGVRIGQEYVEPLRFLGLGVVRLDGPSGVVVGSG